MLQMRDSIKIYTYIVFTKQIYSEKVNSEFSLVLLVLYTW